MKLNNKPLEEAANTLNTHFPAMSNEMYEMADIDLPDPLEIENQRLHNHIETLERRTVNLTTDIRRLQQYIKRLRSAELTYQDRLAS